MRYPSDILERLRQIAPVSEVIGRRLPVRRHGREYQALCPFHKEKTPSFTINDEKGFYHCFGCGAHGDAIGFIKEYEGLSYKEAIEKLAEEVGFNLPKPTMEQQRTYERERSLQEVVEAACAYFQRQLMANDGANARSYISKRGLSREIVAEFRIGYAPEDRFALEKALTDQGFTQAQMIEAGLLIRVDGKEPYSRFRRRVIFPITDRRSEVIAFGGRVLPDEPSENAPKYLNSPETPLFHKGQQLFNLDKARKAARDAESLLVCEGYMDVIALAQAGIWHAVAPLGTAITSEQIQLLWAMQDEPVLCLDGDNAGMRAMQRAAELAVPILKPQKSLRFSRLPAGEDPDTLVKREGAERFLERMGEATPLSEVLWEIQSGEYGHTPEQKAGLEANCMRLVGRIADANVQAQYKRFFLDKLWQFGRKPLGKGKEAKGAQALPALPHAQDGIARREQIERKLFALLLAQPVLLEEAEREEWLSELSWTDKQLNSWRNAVLEHLIGGGELTRSALQQVAEQHEGWGEWFTRETAFLSTKVKNGSEEGVYEAKQLWHKLCATHTYVALVQDVEDAKQALAQDMSEENYSRFTALSEQLRVMEHQRGQFFDEESVEAL